MSTFQHLQNISMYSKFEGVNEKSHKMIHFDDHKFKIEVEIVSGKGVRCHLNFSLCSMQNEENFWIDAVKSSIFFLVGNRIRNTKLYN